eukprot:1163911-Lingulodinium_polyedra.AAC.1
MIPAEGLSELELHRHLGGRRRHLKTILYCKVSQLGGEIRPTWSFGSLSVKTAFLYAELIEEEDGVII